LARAEAYQKQVAALGPGSTALVNAIESLVKSSVPFVPNILVAGGSNTGSGVLEGLAALLMRNLNSGTATGTTASAPEPPAAGSTSVPVG
jgi:hypothetical protein